MKAVIPSTLFSSTMPGKATPREYINVIKAVLDKTIDISKTQLIIEPGSAAIGSAVELHTSVVDVKDTAEARIVTTDGSRIHIDPLWLKQRYMFTSDAAKSSHPKQVICGYTCMDRDRIMVLEEQPYTGTTWFLFPLQESLLFCLSFYITPSYL